MSHVAFFTTPMEEAVAALLCDAGRTLIKYAAVCSCYLNLFGGCRLELLFHSLVKRFVSWLSS